MKGKYDLMNLSFSAEEGEYLEKQAKLYFSHASATGTLEVAEDGSVKGWFQLDMPHIKGGCSYLLNPFFEQMEKLGGFKRLTFDRQPIREVELLKGSYETYDHSHQPDWLTFYFTERQPSGNLAMFKLHATRAKQE